MEPPNIVDLLRGEHAAIETLMEHIERLGVSWKASQLKDSTETLGELLARHATLEDALLFDQLNPRHAGLRETLAALRGEHNEMRAQVELVHGLREPEEIRGAIRELIAKVREHFAVEERVMFEMAGERLGAARLRELGEEWSRRRRLGVED
jgi:hemerythrin-like domain-containing protein